jgi:hypothetical protein
MVFSFVIVGGIGFSGKKKEMAVECYSNYLRLDGLEEDEESSRLPRKKARGVACLLISRLLRLYREGYVFDAEEVIRRAEQWVDFTPDIAQIPPLRGHLLRKFPRETGFALLCTDSSYVDATPSLQRKSKGE